MQRSAPQRSSPRFRDPEDPRRRPPKRDRDLTCAAVILVLGLNASLALVLGALRRESVLDLSRQANLAWRDRALAAEGAVDALAARLARARAPRAPRARRAAARAAGAGRRSVDLWERAEAAAAPPKPAKEPALPPFYGGRGPSGAERRAPSREPAAPTSGQEQGDSTSLQHFGEGAWRPDPDSIFPVVVTKDPATWMKSMCRNQYESRFKHARSRRPRGARVFRPTSTRASSNGRRLYSSEKHRFDHYDRDDLELLKAVAGRSHLFKAMGYDFDVDAALETQRRRRLLFGNATRGRRRR
ncbi:hypothetical protein SO694_00124045 [Aureococcus anophagefferens]|uniref:Uncharacterized protein n=1 Tax=Aureococcus anophagefferens TaxID=44056 RepID=A0ABR1G3C6_AURAN